jgi:hypothetical protein
VLVAQRCNGRSIETLGGSVRRFYRWPSAILASAAFGVAVAADPSGSLVVSWSEKCLHPKQLIVELIVDGHREYQRSIPTCLVERSSLPGGRMTTTLRADRSHFGEPRLTQPEADCWQAGADPDALILGISFA